MNLAVVGLGGTNFSSCVVYFSVHSGWWRNQSPVLMTLAPEYLKSADCLDPFFPLFSPCYGTNYWSPGPRELTESHCCPFSSVGHPPWWSRLFWSYNKVRNQTGRDLNNLPPPRKLEVVQHSPPVQSPCLGMEHLRLANSYWQCFVFGKGGTRTFKRK